jgi:hypothetical protein
VWQTIADVATAVGVVVAIAFGIRSDRVTRDGQKEQKEIAENAASRSEHAAALTEDYTRRVVEALEKIASAGSVNGGLRLTPKVRWTLAPSTGNEYILTNVGDAVARGVTISAHESLPMMNVPSARDLAQGEAVTFVATRTLATSDSTVTVAWADDDGDQIWRYPLPGRSGRA